MTTKTSRISQYQCGLCQEYFDENTYRTHVPECRPLDDEIEETKECPLCKKQVKHLAEHVETCGNETSQTPSVASIHQKQTRPIPNRIRTIDCPICKEPIVEGEYDEHVDNCGVIQPSKTVSTTRKTKRCLTCSQDINEIDYVDHVEQCDARPVRTSVIKKNTKKCLNCSKTFDANEFADHVDECGTKPIVKPSTMKKCPTCSRTMTADELVDHLELCEGEKKKPESIPKNDTRNCPICSNEFPSADLLRHVNSCLDRSSNSNGASSTKRTTTAQTCFTCSATVTSSQSSSHPIPCRSKHIYCIKCLENAMNGHLQSNTPSLCNSNLCDYELSRYDVYCLPLEEDIINRLLPLVKTARRPQCPICFFHVDMQTMDDFRRHALACSGENVPCEHCHCLIGMNELEDHEGLCRTTELSQRQEAFFNYILHRTKYPVTIHQVRVFLEERKKDGSSTDPHDIVNALAELDGLFPFEVPTRDCDVCLESFVYDDIFVFGCEESHKLCYGCFADSTANKMKNNDILTCASCNYQLSDGEIKQLRIPAEQKRKYLDYQTQRTFSNYAGGQGVLKCPNKGCKWIVELENPNDRFKVICPLCRHEFCSLCSQQYHYRTTCQQLPELTQRWFFWCNTERGNYWQARAQQDAVFQAQLDDYQKQRAANEQRNQELRQRYNELVADEQYKAQNCRLCPKCQRVVQRLEGCDSMICGRNYHGGDQQSGCGESFNWARAAPYVPMGNRGPQQVANNIAAPAQQRLVVHEGVQCDACHNEVQGLRFDCVHCASLIFCEKCEQRATLEHSNQIRRENKPQHIFRVIAAAENTNTRF